MSFQRNVLIVEDEVEFSEILRDYLVAEGYEVDLMHSGVDVVDNIRNTPPDLVLLDLMLPDVDGLGICKEVRQFSNLPIIIVTARVDEIDRLIGFDLGVDDYICKPAKPKEVVARVKAVLRRTESEPNQIVFSRLQLDQSQYNARWDGESLELTRVEFRLLDLLSKNSDHVYTRSEIMNVIYEDGRYVSGRSIDSHVKNLRYKLAGVSKIKNPIKSVYGVGYTLEANMQHDDIE